MTTIAHLTMEELDAGLEHIRRAPKDQGVLELIVRRPVTREREVLTKGQLDLAEGLVGDNWSTRGSSMTDHDEGHPEMQLNIMNARSIAHIAQDRECWPLAGDQLYIDMDISEDNMPPGTRLQLGSAIVEVTPVPHNGCKKFSERFGIDAMKWVNSNVGKQLHLRGINAKVVQPGTIRAGDAVAKV
jgi:hypothetical protein